MRQWVLPQSSIVRRNLKRTGLAFAAALAAMIILIGLLAAAVDAGYLRGPFIRFLSAHSGRQIQIDGRLVAHFFSLHPRLSAERVTIGNPTWTPAGVTAELGKISVAIELPWFGHWFGIERIETDTTALHLTRDSKGRANWQLHDPAQGRGGGALPSVGVAMGRVDASRRRDPVGEVQVADIELSAIAAVLVGGAGRRRASAG